MASDILHGAAEKSLVMGSVQMVQTILIFTKQSVRPLTKPEKDDRAKALALACVRCVFFSRAHVSKGVLNFLVWRGFVELGKYGRRFYAHAHFVTASLLLLSFRREEVLGGFFIVFSSCLASLVVCMWVISDLVGLNQNWRENSSDTDR